MNGRASAFCAAGLALLLAAPAFADWYDCFNDNQYLEDPNVWDIDDPPWETEALVGADPYVDANAGALRLYINMGGIVPYGFIAGFIDGSSPDANAATWWDDSASHYLMGKAQFHDPNKGEVVLMLHCDRDIWVTFTAGYASTGWSYIASANGLNWVNGVTQLRNDLDRANGFWMAFQYLREDPNYPPGDPNGKTLKAALWNGGKFDWDGTWDLSVEAGFDFPNRALYDADGPCGIATYGTNTTGLPADSRFDNLEARTGVFTNVSHTLDLTVKTMEKGTVEIDPDLLDGFTGDPNDPNVPRRYTSGTEIAMIATPLEGKAFRAWKIYDPNHPGDPNYAVEDSNSVLYLTMDADYQVEAIFKCGSGDMLPPVGMVLMALMIGLVVRRFA